MTTSLRNYIKYIRPQENIACCTACSVLLAAEIIMAANSNEVNLSRLYLYYMTRKLQGRLGQEGAELKSTMEALQAYGAPLERYWPFSFTRVEREPHLEAMANAANYKAQSYLSISFEEYKSYLDNNIPVIVGMRTGRMFWRLRGEFSEQVYKPVNSTDNYPSKGHAVVIIGYDDNLNSGSWLIANSLGPKWGYQGYGAIPYSCNVDIGESFVITKFAGITAGKKIPEIDK
jgi:C1A family cysteine protease